MTEGSALYAVEAIRYLVKAGCPADVQDNVASTPLHIAAGEGHIEAIKVLVSLVRGVLHFPLVDCSQLCLLHSWILQAMCSLMSALLAAGPCTLEQDVSHCAGL